MVAMDDMYGGTNRYFRKIASKSGIETSYVDATNPTNIESAIKPSTKMVFYYLGLRVETAVLEIYHRLFYPYRYLIPRYGLKLQQTLL